MISAFDDADQAIEKTINKLCRDLSNTSPGSEKFLQLAEAISKLRASLNPTIVQKPE